MPGFPRHLLELRKTRRAKRWLWQLGSSDGIPVEANSQIHGVRDSHGTRCAALHL